jgi:hypothetical protein
MGVPTAKRPHSRPISRRHIVAALVLAVLMNAWIWVESLQQHAPPSVPSLVETIPDRLRLHNLVAVVAVADAPSRRAASSPAPFFALQTLWDTVWSIDATAAEINESNIMLALSLRERAERGDLEATVLLLGAASWCASAGPLSMQHAATRGAPAACVSRFGRDIDSRESLDWAIFRWTMQLANSGLDEATLYASVLGRELLFTSASSPTIAVAYTSPSTEAAETAELLRGQLISQLQSMVAAGSADAASELNGYYLKAIAVGAPEATLARYYAHVAERLDPARGGLVDLTEEWIRERSHTKQAS